MLLNGIDISNYSGNISPGSFAAAKASRDLRFVICGTQSPAITRYQVESARSAGLDVELYTYLYYDGQDAARLDIAISIAQRFGLSRIWIDVETSEQFPPGPEPKLATIAAMLSKVIATGTINAGIYTNGAYWPNMTDEDTSIAAAGIPLFLASWVYNRDITENDFINYATEWPVFGGWDKVHTWQFAADVNLPGDVHCDLCVRYVEEAQPEQPEPQPETPNPTQSEGWYQECLLVAHAMHVGYLAYYKQEWSNVHPLDRNKLYQFARWVVTNVEEDNREP